MEEIKQFSQASGKKYVLILLLSSDLYRQIEESNRTLLRNNEILLENINELKNKNDWLIQNFEEENKKVAEKLNVYRRKLSALYSVFQMNINSDEPLEAVDS